MHTPFPVIALLMASASASPFRPILARQDPTASVPITSSVPLPTTTSNSSAVASDLGVTATLDNGLRLAAAVTNDESQICTLSSAGTVSDKSVITVSGTANTLWDYTIEPTVLCDCGDGLIAGIGTSVGGDGHSTLTCQLGESTTVGVATNTPTANPGDPENPGWADISCSVDSFTDSTNDPWQQWNDSGADAAWQAATAEWFPENPNTQLNLSAHIGNFFHTKPDMSCELLGNGDCESTVPCGEQAFPNADVSSPAGYIIVNSIVGLHNYFDTFYNGLTNALTEVIGDIGSFTDTFSPVTDLVNEQTEQKLTYDALQLGMGILAGFTFSSWFQRSSFFKANPNYLGVTGDTTQVVIGTSFAFVKDAMESESSLPVQNNISSHVVETVSSWVHNVQGMADGLFNNVDNLYDAISYGKTFTAQQPTGEVAITDLTKKIIFANTLPMAWTLGADAQVPFIATSEGMGSGDGSGCDAADPNDSLGLDDDDDIQPYFDSDDDGFLPNSRQCDGDTAYFMYGVNVNSDNPCARSKYDEEHAITTTKCIDDKLSTRVMELKGFDSMDGTKWGGLTIENVFKNALNSWKANGNKNGWATADITTQEGLAELTDGDVEQAKGLVSIPICSFKQMMETTYDDQTNAAGNPNWPCPA